MKLADKTIINVFAKSGEAVFLMASSIIMVRFLSKEDYGSFLQIVLVVNTAFTLLLLGFPQSIYYYFGQASNRSQFILQNIFISCFLSGLAGLFVWLLISPLSGWLNNSDLKNFGWYIALMIFFKGSAQFRDPLMICDGRILLNSAVTVLINLVLFIPIIVVSMLTTSLEKLVFTMFLSNLAEWFIYILVGLYMVSKSSSLDGGKNKPKEPIGLWRQLKYSLPIGLSNYTGIIGKQIDQFIISIYFTPQNFAVYTRGAMRIPLLHTIQFTINEIMMPKYAEAMRENNIKEFLYYFHRGIHKVAKIKFAFFSFLFAVSPQIMTLLYTAEYSEASSIFRAYLLYLIATITVYAAVPRAVGKTSEIFYATLINLVSNVILSLLLLQFWGPIGPALATVFSSMLMACYLLWTSAKILNLSLASIFPWGYLGKLLFLTLLASAPLYFLNPWLEKVNIALIFIVALDSVIYGYLCLMLMVRFNILDEDDFAIFNRWSRFDLASLLKRISFSK